LNPANLLTFLNLVGGVLATGLAVSGRLWFAFLALACAVACDQLDGTVARATGTCHKPFGHVYEGGADLVTCGPGAAAIFFYGEMVHRAVVPGGILAVMWIAAVHLRLTRYTVIGHGDTYMGCPAPLAAVVLAVATLLPLGTAITAIVAGVLSVAMVMSFPIPTAGATRSWLAQTFRSQW
jgi:phosphatidylserine synthase